MISILHFSFGKKRFIKSALNLRDAKKTLFWIKRAIKMTCTWCKNCRPIKLHRWIDADWLAESGKFSPISADCRFLPTADFCRSADFADKIWRLCRPNSDRSENLPTPTRKCRFCRSEIATLKARSEASRQNLSTFNNLPKKLCFAH